MTGAPVVYVAVLIVLLGTPVSARYVKYKISPRRAVCVTEVQALKFIRYEPFDIRIALPDD